MIVYIRSVGENEIYVKVWKYTKDITYKVSQEECARLRESVP